MSEIFVYVEHIQGKVTDITYMNLAQAQAIAAETGNKVVALLLGNKAAQIADDLSADEILYIEHPGLSEYTYDANLKVLANLLAEREPRLVLFGETTIGSDIAGALSSRLNLPLLSFCHEIHLEDGSLKYIAHICNGKIFAAGEIPDGTVLVTLLSGKFKVEDGRAASSPKITKVSPPDLSGLRVSLNEFIEPLGEDIDITKENILIAIGRGIENEDNVEIAQELADALNGAVCASRPVVDQGWLPTTRLVGKSGKNVKPKIYLALGISGAPEHDESIGASDIIIAVNTDENAPIFNLARYGIVEDLLDVAEGLTAAVMEAKGG